MHLFEHVGKEERKRVCFISDRQKGVLIGLENFWPRAWNRYCYRHIYANFKKDFPALQLRSLFWAAAKSSNLIEFNAVMSQIKAVDLVAYSWLLGIPSKHWSRHGFEESIKVDHWATTLPPAIHKRLEDIKKEARHIIPIWAGEDEYEVKDISRHYIPPVKNRLPGRPKLARRREADEQKRDGRSTRVKCGLCRQCGHNKRSCSRNPENINKRTRYE
ncbi:hypothetical protein Dsin_028592, partial [Dipteronia sinensis]